MILTPCPYDPINGEQALTDLVVPLMELLCWPCAGRDGDVAVVVVVALVLVSAVASSGGRRAR